MRMLPCVLIVILPCFITAQDVFEERAEENTILSDIQNEIIELTKSTKESRRKANVESYDKIFLRGCDNLGDIPCSFPIVSFINAREASFGVMFNLFPVWI